MLRFIIRIIGNAVALYVASMLVPGFMVNGTWEQYLIAGVILAILNMVVRPILKVVTFPIILLTLGLFTFIINILILWLLSAILPFISISGFIALFWATIVVSILNVFFSLIAKVA